MYVIEMYLHVTHSDVIRQTATRSPTLDAPYTKFTLSYYILQHATTRLCNFDASLFCYFAIYMLYCATVNGIAF